MRTCLLSCKKHWYDLKHNKEELREGKGGGSRAYGMTSDYMPLQKNISVLWFDDFFSFHINYSFKPHNITTSGWDRDEKVRSKQGSNYSGKWTEWIGFTNCVCRTTQLASFGTILYEFNKVLDTTNRECSHPSITGKKGFLQRSLLKDLDT